MALNLSTGTNILKTFYLPPLQRLFNRQTILWDRIERNDKWNPEGKNFTLGLHYGRHAQAGSGRPSFGATLPGKDNQKYQVSTVPTAYLYTTIEVEGPIIEHARSNAGSFVRAVRSEIEGASESHRKSMNRQANGDGRDALAVTVSGSGTSYVMDDGATDLGVASQAHHQVYLQPGNATQVDTVNNDVSPNVVIASDVTATLGADGATGFTVTFGTSVTMDSGDYIVLKGTLGYQMTGLRAIISASDPDQTGLSGSGGLQGLTVASNPWWIGQVLGSVTSPQDLRFPLLTRVISKVSKASPNGKDDIKFILTSYEGQDTYYELCANERIAVNTMVLDGGFEGLEFSGIPIVADPEHWIGSYDFIVPDALALCQVKDVDWMDKDGNVLSRVANKDSYEATLFSYMNLGTKMRNSLGALVGINM